MGVSPRTTAPELRRGTRPGPARALHPAAPTVGNSATLGKQLDVLLVDDDLEDVRALARLLRGRHPVRIAVGLRDAVHAVTVKVPDVIVCALDMPPYRGDALLAIVAREHPGVRRILFGARPVAPLTRNAAHAVLPKPLDAATLLSAIAGE